MGGFQFERDLVARYPQCDHGILPFINSVTAVRDENRVICATTRGGKGR